MLPTLSMLRESELAVLTTVHTMLNSLTAENTWSSQCGLQLNKSASYLSVQAKLSLLHLLLPPKYLASNHFMNRAVDHRNHIHNFVLRINQ